jgi:hypothetical protein
MTTADILTRVIDAAQDAQGPTRTALQSLRSALEEQIRAETAKKQGRGSAAATIRRMQKSCEKSGRPVLSYAWLDDQGRQCALDGYRAYRLLDPLPLPELPDELQEQKIDVAQIFDPVAKTDRLPLTLPSAQELKAHITIQRAEHGRKHDPIWDFGPSLPSVNAAYLLDLLTIMPDATLTTDASTDTGKRMASPLYATSKAGDAILLPIRDTDKMQAYDNAREAGRAMLQQLFPARDVTDNTCSLADLARLAETTAA